MEEQEKFECFAIPAHVWSQVDPIVEGQPAGWSRRNWVYRDAAVLGLEAIPSPLSTPSPSHQRPLTIREGEKPSAAGGSTESSPVEPGACERAGSR